ncbi:hypothetical protein ES703_58927 [subsurface metagenome]
MGLLPVRQFAGFGGFLNCLGTIAKLSHYARGPQPGEVVKGKRTVRIDTDRCFISTNRFGEFTPAHLSFGIIVTPPA